MRQWEVFLSTTLGLSKINNGFPLTMLVRKGETLFVHYDSPAILMCMVRTSVLLLLNSSLLAHLYY